MKNNNQETVFLEHIDKNAPKYFPDLMLGRIAVHLRSKQERPSAVLYRFDVQDDGHRYSIFVKVPVRNALRSGTAPYSLQKPSLFQRADSQDMHWLQYTALTSIYEYFSRLDNEHLGAIHVLDYLPQYQAIFMEESTDPSLQKLFFKENRFHSPLSDNDLTAAFQNAGRWLHKYHEMPKEDGVQVRHQTRESYIESIITLTDFLSRAWGDEAFFKQTAASLIRNSYETLPEVLPLSLGHGDYALRNILVGSNARVTVLDTFAKWRVPVYEDIGYFLNSLRTAYPQVVSQGLVFSSRQLAAYENAFLMGYFEGEKIPYSSIRLYEILALLDKWSSVMNHYHKRSYRLRYFGGLKTLMTSRYFKTRTRSLLKQISLVESAGSFSTMQSIF